MINVLPGSGLTIGLRILSFHVNSQAWAQGMLRTKSSEDLWGAYTKKAPRVHLQQHISTPFIVTLSTGLRNRRELLLTSQGTLVSSYTHDQDR